MDDKPNQPIAQLLLSGTEIKIGVEPSPRDSSVFIQMDDAPEPSYISVPEARLLISSLEAAVAEATSSS